MLRAHRLRDVVMPVKRGTKRPMFVHKGGQWTWDAFAAFNTHMRSHALSAAGGGATASACAEEPFDYCLILHDLCIVDFDHEDDADMFATRFAGFSAVRDAPRVKTRKGVHFWFRRTQEADRYGFFDGARQVHPRVDFKTVCRSGTGGVVMIPPSVDKAWLTPVPDDPPPHVPLPVLCALARPSCVAPPLLHLRAEEDADAALPPIVLRFCPESDPSVGPHLHALVTERAFLKRVSYFEPFFSDTDFIAPEHVAVRVRPKREAEAEPEPEPEPSSSEEAVLLQCIHVPASKPAFLALLNWLLDKDKDSSSSDRDGHYVCAEEYGPALPTDAFISQVSETVRKLGVPDEPSALAWLREGIPQFRKDLWSLDAQWYAATETENAYANGRDTPAHRLVDAFESCLSFSPMTYDNDDDNDNDNDSSGREATCHATDDAFAYTPFPNTTECVIANARASACSSSLTTLRLFPGFRRPAVLAPGDSVVRCAGLVCDARVRAALSRFPGTLWLAGGAVLDMVAAARPGTPQNDYDLYLVGVADEGVADRIVRDVEAILQPRITHRTGCAITFLLDRPPGDGHGRKGGRREYVVVQFVLRLYGDAPEMLCSFDLPPCKVALTCTSTSTSTCTSNQGVRCRVVYTHTWALSMRRMAFWVDPRCWSAASTIRVLKYVAKGFEAFLPGLPRRACACPSPAGSAAPPHPSVNMFAKALQTPGAGNGNGMQQLLGLEAQIIGTRMRRASNNACLRRLRARIIETARRRIALLNTKEKDARQGSRRKARCEDGNHSDDEVATWLTDAEVRAVAREYPVSDYGTYVKVAHSFAHVVRSLARACRSWFGESPYEDVRCGEACACERPLAWVTHRRGRTLSTCVCNPQWMVARRICAGATLYV